MHRKQRGPTVINDSHNSRWSRMAVTRCRTIQEYANAQ